MELMPSRSYMHTCLQNVMTVYAHQSNTNDQIRNLFLPLHLYSHYVWYFPLLLYPSYFHLLGSGENHQKVSVENNQI